MKSVRTCLSRSLRPAAACAALALALPGCLPLGDDTVLEFVTTNYAVENSLLNDGLFGVVSRIEALEEKRDALGLSPEERLELKALKKVNKGTGTLFDLENATFRSTAKAATDITKAIEKSGTSDPEVQKTVDAFFQASLAFSDDVDIGLSGMPLNDKATKLRDKGLAALQAAADHKQAGRPFSATLEAAKGFRFMGEACKAALPGSD
jgi:hypothetical protein